jgi:hypothetical protein
MSSEPCDLIDAILNSKLNKVCSGSDSSASITTGHGFIGMCSHCHRKMTSEYTFNKHIRTQVCVDKQLRTYCKVCDEVMESRELYTKHILTREHVAKIMEKPVDTLDLSVLRKEKKKNKTSGNSAETEAQIISKNNADPYLDKEDKEAMAPSELTIVFDSKNSCNGSDCGSDIGSISDIELAPRNTNTVMVTPVIKQLTDRQIKVINFLKYVINMSDAANKFLVVLNKLGLDDYHGLGLAIIQCDEIPLNARQMFIGVISKYKELLQKKMIGGKPTHNGIDINLIINSLNF